VLLCFCGKCECCYVVVQNVSAVIFFVKNVSAVMLLWKMRVLLCCEKCECRYVFVKNVSAVMLW
jgi:hypothetical protein